jgi:hypothetical protein
MIGAAQKAIHDDNFNPSAVLIPRRLRHQLAIKAYGLITNRAQLQLKLAGLHEPCDERCGKTVSKSCAELNRPPSARRGPEGS